MKIQKIDLTMRKYLGKKRRDQGTFDSKIMIKEKLQENAWITIAIIVQVIE